MNGKIKNILKKEFKFKELTNLKLIHSGFTKGYSFCSDKGKKFLKIYLGRFPDKIKNNLFYLSLFKIKNELYRKKIPVFMPNRTNKGKTFFKIGSHFAETYDFIAYRSPKINNRNIIKLSSTLAVIHKHKTKNKCLRTFDHLLDLFQTHINKFPTSVKLNACQHINRVVDNKDRLKFVNCHGDYKFSNHVALGNKIYMTDFDAIIYAPRIYDVAITLFSLMENCKMNKNCMLFLKEYNKDYKLTAREKKLLPSMVVLHRLEQFFGWMQKHAKQNNEHLEILKILLKNKSYQHLYNNPV